MSRWVWTAKLDTPLQDSLYYKKPLFNKLHQYENKVNYKRKSRRRFFLLMRSRTPPISSWIPLWNSNGADSHLRHYAYVTSWLGEKKKYHCGGDSWQGGLFMKLKKWVKAVFLLGCYGCIFHRTGNSAQFCQNFGISGGFEHPKPPLGTPLELTLR